jgi:carbamoyl-phosphate synthase small subunit
MNRERCMLVLEDGTVFPGRSFGFSPRKIGNVVDGQPDQLLAGEVVFNTGMTGYHEILTDPSYTGQIVVMTFPHIGNYGADDEWSESGLIGGINGTAVQASGFVVRSLYTGMLPPGRISLDQFLTDHRTPGITEVDTRALTLKLRTSGSMKGLITVEDEDIPSCLDLLRAFPAMEGRNLVSRVGTEDPFTIQGDGEEFKVVVIDCGVKRNIIRELEHRASEISVVPSDTSAEAILDLQPKAVVISNGPGDPSVLTGLIGEIRTLVGKVPLFGICLGHQLLALALGGSTYKLKFGHHGVNNPVRDETTGNVYVTSQNHGFSVDPDSFPQNCSSWFINANDGTVEGLIHDSLPIRSVQFHPEAAPGPRDTRWIFSAFLECARSHYIKRG